MKRTSEKQPNEKLPGSKNREILEKLAEHETLTDTEALLLEEMKRAKEMLARETIVEPNQTPVKSVYRENIRVGPNSPRFSIDILADENHSQEDLEWAAGYFIEEKATVASVRVAVGLMPQIPELNREIYAEAISNAVQSPMNRPQEFRPKNELLPEIVALAPTMILILQFAGQHVVGTYVGEAGKTAWYGLQKRVTGFFHKAEEKTGIEERGLIRIPLTEFEVYEINPTQISKRKIEASWRRAGQLIEELHSEPKSRKKSQIKQRKYFQTQSHLEGGEFMR